MPRPHPPRPWVQKLNIRAQSAPQPQIGLQCLGLLDAFSLAHHLKLEGLLRLRGYTGYRGLPCLWLCIYTSNRLAI